MSSGAHQTPPEIRRRRCPKCGATGGPYPNGDRPRFTSPLISGCSRCGSCT